MIEDEAVSLKIGERIRESVSRWEIVEVWSLIWIKIACSGCSSVASSVG